MTYYSTIVSAKLSKGLNNGIFCIFRRNAVSSGMGNATRFSVNAITCQSSLFSDIDLRERWLIELVNHMVIKYRQAHESQVPNLLMLGVSVILLTRLTPLDRLIAVIIR